MKNYLRRCSSCASYSLSEKCRSCGTETENPHPPKFSLEDKYGEYRRKAKYPQAFQ